MSFPRVISGISFEEVDGRLTARRVGPPPDPESLMKHVSKWKTELHADEFWIEGFSKNGYMFNYMPDRLKTAEMCLEAVTMDSMMSTRVPDALAEIWFCAITANPNVARYF